MKEIVCEVCGEPVVPIRTGTCVKKEMLIADTLWDYTDCPLCGCQIILGRRYRDINDSYFDYLYNQPEQGAECVEDGDTDD